MTFIFKENYFGFITQLSYIFTLICNVINILMHNRLLILYTKKNDFVEGFKILLNTDLKIILLDHQNNFVEILKISNIIKNFDILAISLS